MKQASFKIPSSTNRNIIVESYRYSYEKSNYQEDKMGNYIKRQEFELVIDNVNKLIVSAMCEKKDNEKIRISLFNILVIIISIILTGLLITTIILTKEEDSSHTIFILCLLMVIGVVVLLMTASIITYCKNIGSLKTLDTIIKAKLDAYFEKLHKKSDQVAFHYFPQGRFIQITLLNEKEIDDEKEEEEEKSDNDYYESNEIKNDPDSNNNQTAKALIEDSSRLKIDKEMNKETAHKKMMSMNNNILRKIKLSQIS
jgi:hypothetical protein